ncbi:MAG: single-stranded-DNA-specific exonuclease RecJ [Patescibacteria group bacterium]|nr:single-stranded-DNA-specific exonuclease RecJ [Patescibacteria group bacterium]
MEKFWKVKQKISNDIVSQFPEYDSVILQLLHNRGIDNQEKIDEFFNPDYSKDLFDPFLLKDMDRAVDRLLLAIKNKERVAIFGDYDADGVTSSVLLTELFKKIGLAGQVYIPDRVSEGYGMNKKAIDWLAKKDIKLIVSCDCGVSNRKEIDYAKEKYGIDCVITDHHNVPENFDKKYIVVDSKRNGDKYPYKELAGVGITFKLAQAIISKFESGVKVADGWEKSLLDLVTIGTIADCSPILSENRTLVKYGLKIIKETQRIGLQSLMQIARVDAKTVDSDRVGFVIAPRINSAGRMDRASASYMLLITEDLDKAVWLSKKIDKTNSSRQALTSKLVDEAKKKIGDFKNQKVLMASGWKWPLGVVGIVAGKICEEYNRPTLICGRGLIESVGSARSIPAFDIISAISSCKDLLLEYGGHKQAAGFSLKNENFEKFHEKLEKLASEKLTEKDLQPVIEIDSEIDFKDVNWNLYERLLDFEPHGMGNQKPVFLAKDIQVVNAYPVGKTKKHLKMKIKSNSDNRIFDVIGFNHGHRIEELNKSGKMDIVFQLDCNEWNGERILQLRLIDFKID